MKVSQNPANPCWRTTTIFATCKCARANICSPVTRDLTQQCYKITKNLHLKSK